MQKQQAVRLIRSPALVAACLALLTQAPSARADSEAVGLVVALRGKVTVRAPGERERPIGCGDIVRDGERLATAVASRVAVLTGDVYAHLFVLSAARFSRGPAGGTTLYLERGRMRVVDPRERGEGAPLWIGTDRAQTRFVGNDVDVYVLGPEDSANSMICSKGVELEVVRSDEPGAMAPVRFGECAIASLGKPTYQTHIPSNRIALAEAYDCELPEPVAARFTVTDVAAPPPTGLPLPGGREGPHRQACDVPGAACGGPLSEPIDRVLPSPPVSLP